MEEGLFMSDELVQDGVIRQLQIIGEAVYSAGSISPVSVVGMRRVTSGYRMASHSTVIVFVVLSIIGLMLAGCGSSSWTSITAKRLNSSVGSIIGSLAFD